MTTKKARSVKKKYVPASKLTFLERKILTQWSQEAYVSFDLLERCAKKFESDWGLVWPLTCEFDAQDVVVAKVVSHGANLNVLSVWHGRMCSGGLDFICRMWSFWTGRFCITAIRRLKVLVRAAFRFSQRTRLF
jgi:hypothetical protein